MKDWLTQAACRGKHDIMQSGYDRYDPEAAKDLCRNCPVIVDCGHYLQRWPKRWRSEGPAMVMTGIAYTTGRVTRKRVKRFCVDCGNQLPHTSDREYCDTCTYASIEDVRLMATHLEQLIGEHS